MSEGVLDSIKEQYGALGKGMRRLVWSGIVALIYFALDVTIIQPILEEYSEVTAQIEKAKADAKQLGAQMMNLQNQSGVDGNLPLDKQINKHKEIVAELDARIESTAAQFVGSKEMPLFVEQLLAETGRLKLISMIKFPVELIARKELEAPPNDLKKAADKVAEEVAKVSETKTYNIYRHGISFQVKGRYKDMLRYMQKLENLAWQVNWESASLTTEDGPNSILTLDIYTLSLEEDWIRI